MAWVRYLECTLAMVKEEPAELAGTGSTGGIYHYEPNTLYSTDIELELRGGRDRGTDDVSISASTTVWIVSVLQLRMRSENMEISLDECRFRK